MKMKIVKLRNSYQNTSLQIDSYQLTKMQLILSEYSVIATHKHAGKNLKRHAVLTSLYRVWCKYKIILVCTMSLFTTNDQYRSFGSITIKNECQEKHNFFFKRIEDELSNITTPNCSLEDFCLCNMKISNEKDISVIRSTLRETKILKTCKWI